MIEAFRKASQRDIPYKITERRKGDIAECYADPALALKELGWAAHKGIDEMCRDTWKWQTLNPKGYE